MKKKIFVSLEGFKFFIKPKSLFGAYIAMETFAKGLLKYGHFDEYHSYFRDEILRSLSKDEIKKAYFTEKKLKIKKLKELLSSSKEYNLIHFEIVRPFEEVIFRNMIQPRNIPVTRRIYTISTASHLRDFLHICLLNYGGRPYDSIIAPSKPAQETILDYLADIPKFTSKEFHYKGRVDVIPHGIDINDFKPKNKVESRKALKLPLNRIILLSVARISSESKMNYYRLLTMFSNLVKKTKKKLLLLIAGSDKDKESKKIIEISKFLNIYDKIKIITDFTDEDKLKILSSADIFISLSDNLQESFGISLIEAQSMELPIICTDWSDYKDIVDDGVNGYLIPVGWMASNRIEDVLESFMNPYNINVMHKISKDLKIDNELLIKKTLNLIDDKNLRIQFGKNAREKCIKCYSIRTVISNFEDLWDELFDIGRRDKKAYRDLQQILFYNYPKNFKSYPSFFIS